MQVIDKMFIGGSWVAPAGVDTIEVISPVTEEPIARVAAASVTDVDRAVAAARTAFDDGPWPRMSPADRIEAVRRLAAVYGERYGEMVSTIVRQLGAPVSFAKMAQVGLPAAMLGALPTIAESIQWEESRTGVFGSDLRLRKEPVGVVAAIIPWNMPQFLIVTKLVPALLAGCAVVIKPSPESPLDAALLAEMIAAIDLPDGVVSVVPGGRDIGAHLVGHPGVDKVSFTGSTDAGRAVATACAQNLTRVSLELGGKSAAIALDDADPATVAREVQLSGMGMAGQICNALTRVLVPAARIADYADALGTELSALTIGDPSERTTSIGPLVAKRRQDRVRGYIARGIEEGAKLVTGGAEMPDGVERGWYVRPTVFTDASNDMTIAREEIFGPVITVIPYTDEADAVRLANDSPYGLAGSVFTADTGHGLEIAGRVRSGTFGVNQTYAMDPAAPFGGVKGSGYGRELGREGIEAFLDIKTVSVAG